MVDRDTRAIPAAIKFMNFLHLEVVVTLTNLPHTLDHHALELQQAT